jgi:hypothetical protein
MYCTRKNGGMSEPGTQNTGVNEQLGSATQVCSCTASSSTAKRLGFSACCLHSSLEWACHHIFFVINRCQVSHEHCQIVIWKEVPGSLHGCLNEHLIIPAPAVPNGLQRWFVVKLAELNIPS